MKIPWTKLRGKRNKPDAIIVIKCYLDDDQDSWSCEWNAAHWIDDVGDRIPSGAASAAAGSMMNETLRQGMGQTGVEVLSALGSRLFERFGISEKQYAAASEAKVEEVEGGDK